MNTFVPTEKNIAMRRGYKAMLTDKEAAEFEQALAPASLVEGMSRLIRWFIQQDDVIQGEVLGTIPESMRTDVARLMLQRMAAPDTAGKIDPNYSPPQREKRAAMSKIKPEKD